MLSLSPRRLIANAGSNTAAYCVSLVAAFFLTPIVLKSLNDERYGAWSFVESFIAYLTLFDLGVAAALVRFVPKYVATDDRAKLNRVYSASVLFFTGGAVVAIAIGALFEWMFLSRVLPSADYANEIRWLFRLLVLNFATSLPMSVYPAILDGLGRFVFKSSVRSAMTLVRVPLTLYALTYEQRLISMGIVITGCQLVEYLILAIGTWRFLPTLRFQPSTVDKSTIRDVAGYSGSAFVAMMAGRLSFHTDAFVIGPILGTASITLFAIPSYLVDRARTGLRQATTTLTSAFSALEAAGEHDKLRQTFLAGTRAAWMIALPVTAGLVCLGPSFLQLWIKAGFKPIFVSVLWVLAPLLALTIAQSVASRVLYGTGDIKQFSWGAIAEGISNLILSLVLVYPMGVVGVAIGTAIPHAVFCFWVIRRVCRRLEVGSSDYLNTVAMPLAGCVAPTILWMWFGNRGISSWPMFVIAGSIGVTIYAMTMFVTTGQWRRVIAPLGKSSAIPLQLRRAG